MIERIKSWFVTDWRKVDEKIVHSVEKEHDASWEVEVWWAYKYRHKDTGETKWERVYHKDLGNRHTTFDDPTGREMTWNDLAGSFTSEPWSEYASDD